ncbi:MAG: DUF6046 domain-containing protein [Rikenellaceae bacterium]
MAIINISGSNSLLTPVGISSLGTLIFDNVQFPAGAYLDNDGVLQKYEGVTLDAVQLVVDRAKTIVRTQVEGIEGSIKEYVTNGDYSINLTAILAPDLQGVIPAETFLGKIIELEKVPEAVSVLSKYLLTQFEVQNVVIENIRVEPYDSNSYRLTMAMVSDTQADLKDFG